jgi:lipid-A-disaccharide synthase-like uncharacterized protein
VKYWIIFGFLGQICFSMRFIIQWLYSEKKKKSLIPISFWYFSLIGSVILFIYATFGTKDVVISIGQAFGLFVYTRNLILISRHKEMTA